MKRRKEALKLQEAKQKPIRTQDIKKKRRSNKAQTAL